MQTKFVQISRVLISLLFVLSAISKLISLEFFDGLVAELFYGQNWSQKGEALIYTQILTRILISVELVLGVAVLQSKYLKSIVLPAIQVLLLLFTAHLFYVGFTKGFIGENCGCFGDVIPMDNLESIIKNIITMILATYVFFNFNKRKHEFKSLVPPILIGFVCLVTLLLTVRNYEVIPTISNYEQEGVYEQIVEEIVETDTTEAEKKDSVDKIVKDENPEEPRQTAIEEPKVEKPVVKKSATGPFSRYTDFSTGEKVDLYSGKKMICLFSLSCGHCQAAYKDIVALSKKTKLPPVYLINYGKAFEESYFFSQAGGSHPHIRLENYPEFDGLLVGDDFPKIIIMKDGAEQKTWDYDTYTKEKLYSYFGVSIAPQKEEGEKEKAPSNTLPWDEGKNEFGF